MVLDTLKAPYTAKLVPFSRMLLRMMKYQIELISTKVS